MPLRNVALAIVCVGAFAFAEEALSPELQAIRKEVQAAQARESDGQHNGAFGQYFQQLQGRFKEPKPDDDWLIDSYMFVGAQKIIVDRATDPFAVFREQLKAAYIKRLNLPEDIAAAMAGGVEGEARALAGLSAATPNLSAFRKAANLLVKSSHIVDRCEIPFLAGYNAEDGHGIFIDRDIPLSIVVNRKTIPIKALLNIHERVEKALLDEYHLTYQHAHQIAVRTEKITAQALGVDWDDYDKYIMSIVDRIAKRPTKWIPKSLDLRPYLSYDDLESYQLVQSMRANLVDPALCPPRK